MTILRRLLPAVFLSLLILSCSRGKQPDADDLAISSDSIISPENMALILADVHTVEARILNDRNSGLPPADATPYYEGIFRKHHVSRERYEQNLLYYRHNPESYMKVYDRVIAILESGKARLNRTP